MALWLGLPQLLPLIRKCRLVGNLFLDSFLFILKHKAKCAHTGCSFTLTLFVLYVLPISQELEGTVTSRLPTSTRSECLILSRQKQEPLETRL